MERRTASTRTGAFLDEPLQNSRREEPGRIDVQGTARSRVRRRRIMRRKVIAALIGAGALTAALSPGTNPAPALTIGPVTTPTVQVPSLPIPTPPIRDAVQVK